MHRNDYMTPIKGRVSVLYELEKFGKHVGCGCLRRHDFLVLSIWRKNEASRSVLSLFDLLQHVISISILYFGRPSSQVIADKQNEVLGC